MLGFTWGISYIVPVDQKDYVPLAAALRDMAKCRVAEDKEIYWSYRKTLVGWSIFFLLELSVWLNNTHYSHWVWYWNYALKLLNHLVSFNLT